MSTMALSKNAFMFRLKTVDIQTSSNSNSNFIASLFLKLFYLVYSILYNYTLETDTNVFEQLEIKN